MTTYLVGREKVREYAHAIGETSPLCHDVEAARTASAEHIRAVGDGILKLLGGK